MKLLLAIVLLTIPLNALAATAGTDAYLRELGFTDAQLGTETTTENREAFWLAEGTGRAEDPLGDVLDRFGVTSEVRQPWGDIERAILTKNDEASTWDFTLTFGGAIPDAPTYQAQIYLYMDADGDPATNDREGIRIGTDAEFDIRYDAEKGWLADFRWYNPEADFWAMNKDTSATFDIDGKTVTVRVPFAEAPNTLVPYWRVAVAVADGAKTQIDVAPGTGFPPPLGGTYPTDPGETRVPLAWLAWFPVVLAAGYGVRQAVAKKR